MKNLASVLAVAALTIIAGILSACGGTVGPDEPITKTQPDAAKPPAGSGGGGGITPPSCSAYPNGQCPKTEGP